MTLDVTVPDIFLKIADDIDAIAAAARRLADGDSTWIAESEAGEEVAAEPDFVDEWSHTPVQHVLLTAMSGIGMAEDHLVAMAAAIRAERTVFAPITLSRTVLSAAGTVYYMLEPAIGVRSRLARGWTQQLAAYTETLAIFSDSPDGPGSTYVQERRQAIKASAERHAFHVTAPRWNPADVRGSMWYIESRAPSEGKLIADVMSSAGAVGGTLFRHTSAFVHARPHALSFMITSPSTPVQAGISQAALGYGIDRLLLYVMGAAAAFNAAIARACELFGRRTDEWFSTYRPVILRWAQWLRRLHGVGDAKPGDLARELGLWLPPAAAP